MNDRSGLDLDTFDVLTFDCYGTLIDWESGLWSAIEPVLSRHGVTAERETMLETYGSIEAAIEQGPYVPYATVLRTALQRIGERLRFTPSEAELASFSTSVRDWPPFADSGDALRALGTKYRLAIISNIDDELFAWSARALGVAFDFVITAEQARSYKPSLTNFALALARIGVPRERVLHVAQSVYHDIVPARSLGLRTVWVNRRRGQDGFGATPPADARADLEVPDLRTLAELAGC